MGKLILFGAQENMIIQKAVAAQAIDAVKFHFFLEAWPRHETLELGDTHLRHVLERHVLADRLHRKVRNGTRETQPLHHANGHVRTHALVAVETDAAIRVYLRGRRLANVVQQDGKNERHARFRRQQRKHQTRMHEHITLGVELRGLLAAFAGVQFRQDLAQQTARVEQVEAAHPATPR